MTMHMTVLRTFRAAEILALNRERATELIEARSLLAEVQRGIDVELANLPATPKRHADVTLPDIAHGAWAQCTLQNWTVVGILRNSSPDPYLHDALAVHVPTSGSLRAWRTHHVNRALVEHYELLTSHEAGIRAPWGPILPGATLATIGVKR